MAMDMSHPTGARLNLRSLWQQLSRVVFGPPPPTRLPDRARMAIRDSDDASEIVIGWIQVGAILMFAFLYAISEKSFPAGFPIEPVPLALGVYAIFTAFRLALAYRRRLTARILALSIVVDMTVLMVTIWSSYLQYFAPPGLYLKSPTLLYVFILIALRALRLDPRDVVVAGATALLGWASLVGYVAWKTPGGMEITRSYTEYMTSYKLLIAAELDKLVSISMVTAILSVVVIRARRMLARMAAGESAAHELSRFVGRGVANHIRGSAGAIHAGEGRQRNAAILFVDLRGFTKASHGLKPCGIIQLLEDYQARLVPVIEAAGGHIDKFLGDGILASFGALEPSGTYAADAWRAAERILDASADWMRERSAQGAPPLSVAVALTSGPIVSGVVGHGDRLEFTVIGDAVNLAAKLEKHTKNVMARAIATRDIFDLARAQGHAAAIVREHLMASRVEGVGHLVDLVVLA